MDFNDARYIAKMTCSEIAQYLQLSIRTIKRYQESGKAPKPVIECLLMIGGRCPSFSLKNSFTDWSFSNGYLYTPEGDKYTQGDIRAGKIALLEMNRLYRLQARRRQESLKTAIIYQFPISSNTNKIAND